MDRVKQLVSHLSGTSKGVAALQQKSPDDVVITMAIRSPLCKAKKGGLKDTKCVYYYVAISAIAGLTKRVRTDELLLEMFKVHALCH